MRMYLISDNTDTLTGMRLAGVDGVIVKEKETLEKALNESLKDKNIGIILLTESLGRKFPDLVKTVRTEHKSRCSSRSRTVTEPEDGRISSPRM